MALRDIQLSATESNWRLFMVRKADPAFLAFQNKVLQRDDHTCQFCGYRAKDNLDVINLDGDYRNNRLSNLTAACPLCVQCFFLEAIGKGNFGGGTLIYLPEMTQGELNALCHVFFTAVVNGSSMATEARNIYRSFKLRAQQIEKTLGEGLSDPASYGCLLIDANVTDLEAIKTKVTPSLRLLPEMSRFEAHINQWSRTALEELTFYD